MTETADSRPHAMTAVAWIAIVVLTVFIIGLQHRAQMEDGDIDVNDVSRVNLQLRLMGRYAVGTSRMMQMSMFAQPSFGQQMAHQLDGHAVRPVDRLRVAMVMGELVGADAALQRLEEVALLESINREVQRDVRDLKAVYVQGPKALDDPSANRLRQRHHWFGQLALTHGLDAGDPARAQALRPASRTVIACFMFVIVLGFAGLAGLVLLIVGVVFLVQGKLRPAYAPPVRSTSVWLEVLALFLGAFIALSILAAAIEKRTGNDMMDLLVWGLPLILFWPMVRGVSWRDWRAGLGLHRGRGVALEIMWGVAGQLAGLPLLLLSLILVLLLSFVFMEPAPHPVIDEVLGGGDLMSVVKVYLLACVWAPVVEELVFRGAFYHHMRRRWHAVIAALVSGLVFAAIHPQGVIAVPALTTLAFVFAMLREWRGSIIAPMTAHACNNAFVFTLAILLLR